MYSFLSTEKNIRIILFIAYLFLWAFLQNYYSITIFSGDPYQIALLSMVITLSILVLFVEHFFTRPTDVMASSIAILLMLAPMQPELKKNMGWLYSASITYALAVGLLSFISLFMLNNQSSPSNVRNKISYWCKFLTVNLGHARLIYALPYFSIAANYSKDNFEQWGLWFSLFTILALLPINKISRLVAEFFQNYSSLDKSNSLGEIVSVHGDGIFGVNRYKDSLLPLKLFDTVEYRFKSIDKEESGIGFVISKSISHGQEGFKFIKLKEESLPGINDRQVHKAEPLSEQSNIVGITFHGTDVFKLKFEYMENHPLEEGDVIYVDIKDKRIFYQVTNAINTTEQIQEDSEVSKIIGHANQLGLWDEETLSFNKFGWVPAINSTVHKCLNSETDIPNVTLDDADINIGDMQGINLPINLNVNDLVTHHTAILGVTGTGKSVLSRQIIADIASKGIKVICVDFTNEHESKLVSKGLKVRKAIDEDTKARDLSPKIEKWAQEMEKFANQRSQENLKTWEREIMVLFGDKITEFVQSDDDVAILDLPDFTSTNETLEFTKWFMRGLFKVARDGDLKDSQENKKQVAIVLEEAHTVIPEWNFGDQQKSTQAAINSISQIALQGRKYGVGFVVLAQRTASVSKTVLTQCNTVIAFKQFDNTSCEFLSNYFGSDLSKLLPNLKFRQAMVTGKAFKGSMPVIFNVKDIKEA